jgi:hypothetical protein
MMTTAAFAQTKFGSTKLKTSSKRTHRMSPTEFSNYIKQRAIQQQQQKAAQQQQQQGVIGAGSGGSGVYMNNGTGGGHISRPRSLSPQDFGPFGSSNGGLGAAVAAAAAYPPMADKYSPFDAIWSNPSPTTTSGGTMAGLVSTSPNGMNNYGGAGAQQQPHNNPFDTNRQLLEGLSLGLNAVPYRGQYQHLLVAN